MSAEDARLLRLCSQRLAPRCAVTAGGVAGLVGELCGVQAQDPAAAALALRARGAGVRAAVDRARLGERSIVRTWCMRGTLHLLAAADLGWLLPLHGPVFVARSRRRCAALGLAEGTARRGIAALRDILAARGPLTRAEIVAALGARDLRLRGQAGYHLLRRAALEGVVCCGPDRDREPAYALLANWAPPGPAPDPDQALAELARRYLDAYAPAGVDDLAAWSGLPAKTAHAAWRTIADEMLEVDLGGRPAAILAAQVAALDPRPPQSPIVRLVPSFDTYLLGYRDRDLAVAPRDARRIHPGGGVLHPTLLVDGRAAGTWRLRRDRGEVVVEPFARRSPAVAAGLEAEAADVGRFLGLDAALVLR